MENREALYQIVRHWDSRLRWQHSLSWLPRSLLPGLWIGIVLGLVFRSRPGLTSSQIVPITGGALLLGVVAMLVIVRLWPRSPLDSARRFDLDFGLKERVSTALELSEGRILSNDELTAYQIDDARQQASAIRPDAEIPLLFSKREWVTVGLTAAILLILLLLPTTWTEDNSQRAAQQATIEEAVEDLKDLTETVANDTALDDPEREELLETLETSIETLQEEDISAEEAFAVLSEVETKLQAQAERLEQSLQAQQEALRDAFEALSEVQEVGQTLEGTGENATFEESLESLAQDLDGLTPAQREELAAALEQAASALEQTNPEAADALRDAAEALRNGDLEGAQQSLEQAQQSLQQSQQDQTQQQNTAEQLQSGSQQAQESSQELSQQSQQGEQQQGEGEEGQESSQQAQQPGQSQSEQGDGQPVPGSQSQPGQSVPQDGEGDGDQPGDTQRARSDAGDSEASPDVDTSGRASAGEINADNDPDGTGERDFAPIFVPRRLGGQSEETLALEPDGSDLPVVEGNFTENPEGDVTIPYNQVFSQYQDSVNRALDSGYVPLGLRDVVRDYFTSLDPQK